MISRVFLAFLVCIMIAAESASAKRFTTSYCSFWIPDDWDCELEGTEYVCRPLREQSGRREVILIIAAKLPGPMDSFNQYIDHLQKDPDGAGSARVAKPPRLIKLGGRTWVDATHNGGEMPNYSTRYLATFDESVAILFTVSLYNESADQFGDIVEQIAVSVRARSLRQ